MFRKKLVIIFYRSKDGDDYCIAESRIASYATMFEAAHKQLREECSDYFEITNVVKL